MYNILYILENTSTIITTQTSGVEHLKFDGYLIFQENLVMTSILNIY